MYKLLDTNLDERDHLSLSLAERDMPAFNKVANQKDFPEEVDEAIKSLNKKKGHSYLLLTAMGDGDTWGANNNSDYFPRAALLGRQNAPVKWGSVSYEPPRDERLDASRAPVQRYRTFEDAHFFHHHRNRIERDPAFGAVRRAVWFPRMGTVLLLIEIDDAKDPESAEAIAKGAPLAFSMGCKVPYDVCSICGNRAASLFQYCGHLRNEKNRILADGRRVSAVNLHPRFFDISKVTRPAFQAGMSLQKIASLHRVIETPSSIELADYYDLASFDKTAGGDGDGDERPAIPDHLAEAIKRVSALEKNIPFDTILDLVELCGRDVQKALGAFAYRGIVLKPNEFVAIILLAAGKEDIAKRVHSSNVVLDARSKMPDSHETADFSTPSVAHGAEAVGRSIPEGTVKDRSVVGVEDRVYSSGENIPEDIHKTAESFPTGPELGIGAIMTGLYMLYRDKLKDHPGLSAAVGAALGYTLSKTNNASPQPPFVGGVGPLGKQASFYDAYVLKSYI